MFSIFVSPFLGYAIFGSDTVPIEFWMIATACGAIFGLKRILSFRFTHPIALLFVIYILVHALFSLLFTDTPGLLLKRLLLFAISFSVFLIILDFADSCKVIQCRLWSTIRNIVIIVCAYGIYQFIARVFGFPFAADEILRGRLSLFGIKQISSFFEEPAYLCQFLITNLYMFLFVSVDKNKIPVLLILINIILSMSLTGYISMIVLITTYLLTRTISISNREQWRLLVKKKALWIVAFIVLAIVVGWSLAIDEKLTQRVNSELLGATISTTQNSSGAMRIYGEMGFIVKTLKDRPLVGYGIDYDKEDLQRSMALNAITEILVRWGLLGLVLLIMFIISEKLLFPSRNIVGFIVFTTIFFSMDGAIAKPIFWLLLALVLLMERIELFNMYHRNRILIATTV